MILGHSDEVKFEKTQQLCGDLLWPLSAVPVSTVEQEVRATVNIAYALDDGDSGPVCQWAVNIQEMVDHES